MARLREIDVIRGVAVIGMIIYHLLVDLEMYLGWKIGVFDYPVVILARMVGAMFVTLLGVGAFLQLENRKEIKGLIKRAIVILGWAGVVSGVTYLGFGDEYIRFGILHLLGITLLLLIPLMQIKSNLVLIILGAVMIVSGIIWEIPSPATLDFYPPLPWSGLAIWGIVLGRKYLVWREGHTVNFNNNSLEIIGKNSLLIYLVHQPILLGLLFLVEKIIKSL